jgi:hypothetical protein
MEPLRAAAGSRSITYFIAAYDETYGITHETNEILHDIIFGRQRQSPETRLAHDHCITNTGVPSCSSCSSPPEQSGSGLLLQR